MKVEPHRRYGRAVAALLAAAVVLGPVLVQAAAVDAATKKLMAAVGFFRREMYDLAVQEYEEFLKEYPGHKEATSARYGLAVSYYRMDRYGDAVSPLREAVKDRKFKQRDEALAVLAHCQLTLEDYVKALAACNDLLENHPKSSHAEIASLYRAQALYLLKKPEEALKACQEFIEKYPDSGRRGEAEFFLACSQEALEKHADAAATLDKFLAAHADSPRAADATLLWGQALENDGKFTGAAEKYRQFIERAGDDRKGQGHYSLALALYKAGGYDESVVHLQEVVDKHFAGEYGAPARLQLGLAQLAAGKPADARTTLEKVVRDDEQRRIKARYWLAQCDIAELQYGPARDKLQLLSEADPPPPNLLAVLYDKALCAMEMGDFEIGVIEFAAFREKHPTDPQAADALYRQAFCLHKLEKYPESQALCEKIPADAGERVAAATAELAAENLFLMEKHDQAAKRFEQLVKSAKAAKDEPREMRFSFRLGQCAFLMGDYKRAIQVLSPVAARKVAADDANLREAVFFLGDAQFQDGQYAEAAKTFAAYLAGIAPRSDEATFKLGLSQLRADQVPEAEKTLSAVAAAEADSPWDLRATFAYGQMAYQKLNQPDKAAEALKKVLAAKDAPEDLTAPTIYLLASIDFDAKRYDEAAKRFAEVVQRFGKHELASDAALQRAICMKETDKNDEAVTLLRDFVKAYPKSPRLTEARHLIGTCLAKLDKHEDAVKAFTDLAADKKTSSESVLYELAWSQRAMKHNDKAAEAYRKLMEEFPDGKLAPAVRTELAELLYLDKKYKEAAELLEKVVADKKADAKTLAVALYRLGWCRSELSEPAKAAEAFARFVKDYPEHELTASATYQLGVARMTGEENEAAAQAFGEMLTKFPDHEAAPVAQLKLGEVQGLMANFEESAKTYQAFLKKNPESEFAYLAKFGIGWAAESRKDYDEARKWYEQVTASHNGPTAARAQFQIGECYFAQGEFQRAVRELLNVDIVYAYPEWSSLALYEAGRAFEQLGQANQARRQYQDCVKRFKNSDSAALADKRLKEMAKSE